MIERIRTRPHPKSQIVDAADVIDASHLPAAKNGRIDLSKTKHDVLLTQAGMEKAINMVAGRCDKLIACGVFRAAETSKGQGVVHHPSWTRNDYFTAWADQQPKPATCAEFDRIYDVRALLSVDITHPHPRHIIEGAGEFLASRGIDRSEELLQLLHCTLKASDPTNRAFKEWSDRGGLNASRGTATVSQIRRLLPDELAGLPGTALDREIGEDLGAPDPRIIWELVRMGPLRTCAAIYVFTLAATVPSETSLTRTVLHLRRLDESFSKAGNPLEVLRGLASQAGQSTSEGRRAILSLNVWLAMSNALAIERSRLPKAMASHLTPPGSEIAVELADAVAAIRRAMPRRGEARLATSSALADNLDGISRALDRRYREVEELDHIVSVAQRKLSASCDDSMPIVHRTLELDPDGLPTGRTVRHEYRLWRSMALLSAVVDDAPDVDATVAIIGKRARDEAIHSDTEFMLTFEYTDGENEPWFLPLFRNDAFGGAKVLPTEIRSARYDLIAQADLPGNRATPDGVLDFRKYDKAIARAALVHGRIPIAIHEFAIAMRIAHTVFHVGTVTAARAGEILQMRMDGKNFGHEQDQDLAFWTAVPKQTPDRAHHEPTVHRNYLDDDTMAMVVELRNAMRAHLGEDAASTPILLYPTLRDRVPPAPWLLRSQVKPYDPSLLKLFLRYLAFGIASFGVHDIRAAVAKNRLDRGDSLQSIKQFLGHRSESISMNYSRPTKAMKQRRLKMTREMSDAEARLARLDKVRNRL
ncbi:MAG: hypothetical protein DI636_07970 [Pelagerythrobacter marensis]|nr:MAG: hypothetical protein DI636_07970 [Pelagerythrobacter marensis]PZU15315.1 MAG: hypothetical protein DI591_10565 [Citromicrobium sp.]